MTWGVASAWRQHIHDDDEAATIMAVGSIAERQRLLMMAAVVSAAIALHNIPEGMATYVASFHSVRRTHLPTPSAVTAPQLSP